jgi:SP family general alpha glucoside:H+ symporter-like MFS transporter
MEPKDEVEKSEKADILHSEVLANKDLMNDAFDGENREHEMGVWEAAKSHPWACLWAFTMCFTIVSLFLAWNCEYSFHHVDL